MLFMRELFRGHVAPRSGNKIPIMKKSHVLVRLETPHDVPASERTRLISPRSSTAGRVRKVKIKESREVSNFETFLNLNENHGQVLRSYIFRSVFKCF